MLCRAGKAIALSEETGKVVVLPKLIASKSKMLSFIAWYFLPFSKQFPKSKGRNASLLSKLTCLRAGHSLHTANCAAAGRKVAELKEIFPSQNVAQKRSLNNPNKVQIQMPLRDFTSPERAEDLAEDLAKSINRKQLEVH